MKAILVRVGVDQAYGAWNAPVNPETGEFVYIPIPDGPAKAYTRGFAEIDAALADFAAKNGVSGLRCPESLRQRNMHLDPDFENLTYGDNGKRRGSAIAKLTSGDLLVFYAGMRSINPPRKLVYALLGLFVIEDVVRAVAVPPERWHQKEGSMAPFDQRSMARPIRFGMALPASWSRRCAQLGGAGMNGSIPDVDRRHRAGQAYAARAGLRHIRQRLWNRRAGGIRPPIIQTAFH
jgi:hypothetical protein